MTSDSNSVSTNSNLYRIERCVLTKCDVTYGGHGSWVTLTNGMPTEVEMSLMFVETRIIDKKKISSGY